MTKKITTVEDYLVGKSELELERVRDLLKQVQAEGGDYFHEKAVAKMVAYHEIEVQLIAHYVEMKVHYPDLATVLEERKPYLATLYNTAFEEWGNP